MAVGVLREIGIVASRRAILLSDRLDVEESRLPVGAVQHEARMRVLVLGEIFDKLSAGAVPTLRAVWHIWRHDHHVQRRELARPKTFKRQARESDIDKRCGVCEDWSLPL
jgi:hypothetical protein